MNSLIRSFGILMFFVVSVPAIAQEEELLTDLPATREEFTKSETAVINTVNWLENTPTDKYQEKRKLLTMNLTAWIVNSPSVTINLRDKTTPFIKKNNSLMIYFMGGWTRYSLQNNYSKDEVKCTLAGIRCAMKIYQADKGMKKDKSMDKLIELDGKGDLESWIAEQLK